MSTLVEELLEAAKYLPDHNRQVRALAARLRQRAAWVRELEEKWKRLRYQYGQPPSVHSQAQENLDALYTLTGPIPAAETAPTERKEDMSTPLTRCPTCGTGLLPVPTQARPAPASYREAPPATETGGDFVPGVNGGPPTATPIIPAAAPSPETGVPHQQLSENTGHVAGQGKPRGGTARDAAGSETPSPARREPGDFCPCCYDPQLHRSTGMVLGTMCTVCDGSGYRLPSPETGTAAGPTQRPLDKAAEWARMSGVDSRDPGPAPEPVKPPATCQCDYSDSATVCREPVPEGEAACIYCQDVCKYPGPAPEPVKPPAHRSFCCDIFASNPRRGEHRAGCPGTARTPAAGTAPLPVDCRCGHERGEHKPGESAPCYECDCDHFVARGTRP